MKLLLPFLFVLTISIPVKSAPIELFQFATFSHDQLALDYRILYPRNFTTDKEYPVVFFLHGAGERGSDNKKQLTHGANIFLNSKFRASHQVITIIPQVPKDDYWAAVKVDRTTRPLTLDFNQKLPKTHSMRALIQLVEQVKQKNYVDNDKLYVMGLSMGGMGVYEILTHLPTTFSSAIAICGAAPDFRLKKIRKNMPLWIFHGDKDEIVDYAYSESTAKHFNDNTEFKFTSYSGVYHNSWDNAFAEPKLLDWLLSY
ncbi:prolyl oligopeptidase family serine peptidase [Catenovulum agarivorans]|uniref:carboxylesterase family protein n=1 Tax=Catenovulum agarivorans TaxID=1172192 RepID=UPI0002EF057D|nr:dienelactone hydrolase family protein [Catenovulum agarivorans]